MGAKKVFLINTHLNNIINAPAQLIHNLRYLFGLFEGRNDCVVLWRPHPLSISTIEAMNPVLYHSYMGLIDEFKKLPNGIFDDSPDLHRSIGCSDAYIGDPSSLVEMYSLSGKPVLITQYLSKNDSMLSRSIQFNTGFKKDNWFYFSAFYFNGFFRMDLVTGKIFHLGEFPSEDKGGLYLHSRSHTWGNYGWFIPSCGDFITKVDLRNLSICSIPAGSGMKEKGRFGSMVVAAPYMWLIPVDGYSVLRLNMKTDDVKEYSGWPEDILYEPGKMNFYNGVKVGNNLIFCPFNLNRIIVMDCENGDMESYPFPYPLQSFHDIAYRDHAIWFCPYRYDKIVKWDMHTHKFEEVDLPFERNVLPDIKYMEFMLSAEALYLRPQLLGSIPFVKIETASGNVKIVDKVELGEWDQCNINGEMIEDKLWLYSPYINVIIEMDGNSGKLIKHSLTVSSDFYSSCVPNEIKWEAYTDSSHSGCLSDLYLNIEEFVEFVCGRKVRVGKHTEVEIQKGVRNADGMTGKRVWELVKKVL